MMITTHQSTPHNSGFAMLFTVLIVSLILSIAISISNLTLRQTLLSNLAKDSQIAFYQADAAVECGMQQDIAGNFPLGATGTSVPPVFDCGTHQMKLVSDPALVDYFEYTEDINQTFPCFKIVFDKTGVASNGPSKVQGYGYNICDANNPRQVERALEVKY